MELTEYLDRARQAAGIDSDRRLAVALGISQTTIRQYRAGLAAPSPERMVTLAELAGVPPRVALLDCLAWRSDGPRSRELVAEILASVKGLAAAILLALLVYPPVAHANRTDNEDRTGYIMERKRRRG